MSAQTPERGDSLTVDGHAQRYRIASAADRKGDDGEKYLELMLAPARPSWQTVPLHACDRLALPRERLYFDRVVGTWRAAV